MEWLDTNSCSIISKTLVFKYSLVIESIFLLQKNSSFCCIFCKKLYYFSILFATKKMNTVKKRERLEIIFAYLKKNKQCKTSEILELFWNYNVERTTIYRDLKKLIEEWKIFETWRWIYVLKIPALEYLETPFFNRPKKKYNSIFLKNYIPNKTFFLSKAQRDKLHKVSENFDIDTFDLTYQKRNIETLLIDLSFSSSHLEWNTYSYLDTEVLIQYNEVAENKLKEETQMVINHKQVIQYMLSYRKKLEYSKKTFFEIHQILWYKLLHKEDLWIIRSKEVEIGRSAYKPIDNKYQLEEEFESFLEKLNQIKDPFEQSLFILVFVPYFQIFLDINKRTSRMSCNLPLLKNNLWIVSLMQVKKKDYITAILAIYELNDTSLMAHIFTNNYILNYERYI